MHHSLKLYGSNRKSVLRLYMFFARWTKIPLVGRLVRWTANAYGRNLHRAHLLTPSEAEELVGVTAGVAVTTCDCRKVYRKCDNPVDTEILLGPTRHVMQEAMPDGAREISREATHIDLPPSALVFIDIIRQTAHVLENPGNPLFLLRKVTEKHFDIALDILGRNSDIVVRKNGPVEAMVGHKLDILDLGKPWD